MIPLWSTAWAFRNVLDVLAYFPFNNFKLTKPAVIPASRLVRIIVLERRARITAALHVQLFTLAGIKFDDSLFVGDGLDLIAGGNAHHHSFEGFLIQRKPIRHRAARSDFEILGSQ